jgi:hypothetical protein
MNEIYIVNDFTGAQMGTKDNPFVTKTSTDFDALMRAHAALDQLAVYIGPGAFSSVFTLEWNDSNDVQQNPGFRMGRQWTVDLDPNTIFSWDIDSVPDSRIDNTPFHGFLSTEARFDARLGLHTPEDVWNLLPRGQAVRGGTIDLQFSKAVDRFKALGKKLKIGGVLLSGHEAAIEKVRVTNYGALGYENFPLIIVGGIGQYDRNLIAQLDPTTHILDANLPDSQCSHITDCPADGFDLADTNDQVTVRMITGNIGSPAGGNAGPWVQHMRAFAYQTGNKTLATGKNMVQGHTIYQVLRGQIQYNSSDGAAVGAYGDFFKTKGLDVSFNTFLGCDYAGIRFLLSPSAAGMGDAPLQFSHENYTIGPNQITSNSGVQVDFDTYETKDDQHLIVLPQGPTRFIRNMRVDASLLLDNKGATNVTRTNVPVPTPAPAKKSYTIPIIIAAIIVVLILILAIHGR